MDRRLQPRRARPTGLCRAVALCALSAGWCTLPGCDPPASQSLTERRPTEGRYEEFFPPESILADQDAPGTSASPRRSQSSIPLPPGWAERYASDWSRGTNAGPISSDSFGHQQASPDGVEPGRSSGYGTTSPGRSAAKGLYGKSDPHQPAPAKEPDYWAGARRSAAPPRPKGNYIVMAVVFLVPLAVLIPVVWIWHLLRALRFGLEGRSESPPAPRTH